jgi:Tfp pilus assembly protein PilP
LIVTALLAFTAWGSLQLQAQTQPPKSPQGGKQRAKRSASAKPAAPAQAAPATKKPKRPAKKAAKTAKPAAAKKAAAKKEVRVARRDPFDPLVGKQHSGAAPDRLPPGKAGLVVSTLRVDGIVRSPNGMIAVVSNPQQRVYFLREGDQLYDGKVEHITLEAVAFHEVGKDAFGKPVERQVIKRLYPSAGEQP